MKHSYFNKPKTIICLAGPTAAGKTGMALKLASRLPVDLISVDSGQVYSELNIGTAKPDIETLSLIPHGLINIRKIDQPFSAADFCVEATKLIKKAFEGQRIPLLVGGTMFYFSALFNGLPELPGADKQLRKNLLLQGMQLGWKTMHSKLLEIDPDSANRIQPSDSQRIARALEINLLKGARVPKPVNLNLLFLRNINIIKICLFTPDRSQLHRNIANRFQVMLDKGLVCEALKIKDLYSSDTMYPALRNIGYRQVFEFLDGKINYEAMVDKSLTATRRMAKRQLTWIRNESGFVWLDSSHNHSFDILCEYLRAVNVK